MCFSEPWFSQCGKPNLQEGGQEHKLRPLKASVLNWHAVTSACIVWLKGSLTAKSSVCGVRMYGHLLMSLARARRQERVVGRYYIPLHLLSTLGNCP